MQFAHRLVGELKAVTRMHKTPLKSAGFRVLAGAGRAFGAGRTRLRVQPGGSALAPSGNWRNRTADSIAQAIDGYFCDPHGRRPHRVKVRGPE